MTYERIIETHLSTLAGLGNGLFTTEDLRALLPDLASGPMRSLLHRLCKSGYFVRLTRNLFLRPVPNFHKPDVLFHMAAKLRDDHFNYLSLETVLSREGYISQVPMQWISLMSSGRSYTFRVKEYGTIEFVHTKRIFITTRRNSKLYLSSDSNFYKIKF